MARPKKNGVEQPLDLKDDKLPLEAENAQQSKGNEVQQQENEQQPEAKEEFEVPFELESYAMHPIMSEDGSSFLILAPNDIEARQGRIFLKTGVIVKEGYRGLIVPTSDNAANGLPTETDYRLQHSDVISMQAASNREVKLVLNINDDTMIQEQTNFGSRSRNLVIPKGTPLAELMIFKLRK